LLVIDYLRIYVTERML